MMSVNNRYIDDEIMEQLQHPIVTQFFTSIYHARRPRGNMINWTIEARPVAFMPSTIYEQLLLTYPFKAMKSAKTGEWLFCWNGSRQVGEN